MVISEIHRQRMNSLPADHTNRIQHVLNLRGQTLLYEVGKACVLITHVTAAVCPWLLDYQTQPSGGTGSMSWRVVL